MGKGEVADLAPFPKMSPLDRTAFSLALFRYTRVMADLAQAADYREMWAKYGTSNTFWLLMVNARRDLTKALREGADHPTTALALLLYDDVAQPESTVQRDRAALAQILSLSSDEYAD
jgi:hypothetical protein